MVTWGIVTMCTAVRVLLRLAEVGLFPGVMMHLCSWYKPEECAFAVKRLGPHAPSMSDRHWDPWVAKDTLSEPMLWLYAAQYFLTANPLNAFATSRPPS